MKGKYPNGLRAAMARAGVGPTELADRISSLKQNVQRWADGERKLPIDIAERMAPVLETTVDELVLADRTDIARVPLIDWVSAGQLAEPRSQVPVEKVPLLAFTDLGRGDFFALRVQGSSMDRLSPEGSIIVVNRADRTLVSGRCYVFSLRGETTYKRWQADDPPYLEPYSTDPVHKPIFVKQKKGFAVVGRVRRTLLDL